jgi:membrane-associated phospholipid phosphatase
MTTGVGAQADLSSRAVPARLDTVLLRVFRTRYHAPTVERGVLAFTRLGEHGGVWFALAATGAALDEDRRPLFARAATAIGAAYAINQLIKLAVRRRRPELEDLPPLVSTGSRISYPSAHASTSFAGARALARAWPGAPLYATAAAMALSRPYVGVHYPSDIVAGAALGAAVAELAA